MRVTSFFSEQDRAAIKAAVGAAETGTAGEIVPAAVERCDRYAGASWFAAVLGALAASLIAAVVHAVVEVWSVPLAVWIAVPPFIGAALGFAASELSPAVKRALLPSELLEERVAEQAAATFLREEVFSTRDRTGILIFVALFEHRVVVLGDSGINARVEPAKWQGVVDGIVAGIRRGTPGAALAEGIRACGEILATHRVERRPDDTDELPDGLREGA